MRGYHPEDRGLQEEGSIYIFFLQISPASVTLRHGSWLEGELRAWLLLGTHTQEDYLVSVSLSLVFPPYMPSLWPTITPGPSLSINKAVDQGLGHEHPGGVERASLPATSDYPCLPETWPTSAPSHLAFFFFFLIAQILCPVQAQEKARALWPFRLPYRRRQLHPTPVLLPGKSHGRRSLVSCRLWGRTESDTTEVT